MCLCEYDVCVHGCVHSCVHVSVHVYPLHLKQVWILSKKQNKQKRTKPLKKKFLINQTHGTLHIKMSNNHTTLSPIKWSTLFLMKI